jgi:hypothetical protein
MSIAGDKNKKALHGMTHDATAQEQHALRVAHA